MVGRFFAALCTIVVALQAAESIANLASMKPEEFARPMNRQDVLLSQFSVQHLAEYKAADSDIDKYRQQQISFVNVVYKIRHLQYTVRRGTRTGRRRCV
jgi:hypothetical protein